MDLVEILRDTTASLSWEFHYGRRDFNNLVTASSENDLKWFFFLDPISRDGIRAAGNLTGEYVNEGYFMILSKSDLDEVYDSQLGVNPDNGKYRMYIKPKLEKLYKEFEDKLNCIGNLEIKKMRVSDVINLYDENMDGILVQFAINTFE